MGLGSVRLGAVAFASSLALVAACGTGPDLESGDAADAGNRDGPGEEATPADLLTWVVHLTSTRTITAGFDVAVAGDGSIFVGGLVRFMPAAPLGGDRDGWLAGLDADGNLRWQMVVGGSGDDYPTDLFWSNDGLLTLVGTTSSFGGGLWLAGFDDGGTGRWQKTIGGVTAAAGAAAADGGTVLVGESSDALEVWVARLDSAGEPRFAKSLGTPDRDRAGQIVATADGGCIVSGLATSDGPTGRLRQDFWLARLGPTGELVWQRRIVLADSASHDPAEPRLVRLADGGVLLLGHAEGNLWAARADASGNVAWQETFSSSGGNNWLNAGLETDDGSLVLVGTQNLMDEEPRNQARIMRLAADGGVLGSTTFAGDQLLSARGIAATPDGGMVVVAGGDYDAWLLKLGRAGEFRGTCSRFTDRSTVPVARAGAVTEADLSIADAALSIVDSGPLTMDAGLTAPAACPE